MEQTDPDRLIQRDEVEHLTGLSRSSIYRLVNTGFFPRPVRLGKRTRAWNEAAVRAWIREREVAQPDDVTMPQRATAPSGDMVV